MCKEESSAVTDVANPVCDFRTLGEDGCAQAVGEEDGEVEILTAESFGNGEVTPLTRFRCRRF